MENKTYEYVIRGAASAIASSAVAWYLTPQHLHLCHIGLSGIMGISMAIAELKRDLRHKSKNPSTKK
jgi:predicted CDP-diglyceride synthetase/phosphatidate cytidylyltransferase